MKIRAWLSLVLALWLMLPVYARAGGVLAERFFSPTLGHDWPYNVYLPKGYESDTQLYPVVYMLHGASQDEAAWVRWRDRCAGRQADRAGRYPALHHHHAGGLDELVCRCGRAGRDRHCP